MNKTTTKAATSLVGSLIGLKLSKNTTDSGKRITSLLIGGFVGGLIGDVINNEKTIK